MSVAMKLVLVVASFVLSLTAVLVVFGVPVSMLAFQDIIRRPEALGLALVVAFVAYTVGAIVVGLSQQGSNPRSH